jgi:hypothetical protein
MDLNNSYLPLCRTAYPYVCSFPEPRVVLDLWALETERKSTRPHSIVGLELSNIPQKTLERIIRSNVFAQILGLKGSGRPSKEIYITEASRLVDISRGRKLIESRLGLGRIFDDSLVAMQIAIFERDVRSPKAHLLVVAGTVNHGEFLEIRALASTQSNLGYGERFMRKLQEKRIPLLLFSAAASERFYTRMGFSDCSRADDAWLSRCLQFVRAKPLIWRP